MLYVLRLSFLLLGLSFLTGLAAVDLGSRRDGAAYSTHAKFSTSHSGSGAFQVRLGSTHARLITAELEDGPDGEEGPVATFTRSYNGDDQIQAAFDLAAMGFSFAGALTVANWTAPEPGYPPVAGFPTGPPVS